MKTRVQRGSADVMASLLVAAVVLAGYAVFAAWSCGARWSASGMRTSWGPVQGCLVQTPAGRWVPDDRVRDIDISSPQQPRQGGDIPK